MARREQLLIVIHRLWKVLKWVDVREKSREEDCRQENDTWIDVCSD
jgi:hypothetical protein